MSGRNHLFKHWRRPSLEVQVLKNKREINKIKEETSPLNELVIGKNEECKPKQENKTKKKKTANDIHKEIKELTLYGNFKEARRVLIQALQDGFKGKRLSSWSLVLALADNEGDDEEMGSGSNKLWNRSDLKKISSAAKIDTESEEKEKPKAEKTTSKKPQKKKSSVKEKKEKFTGPEKSSTINETKEEKETMTDIPDLPLDELEEAAETEQEDYSVHDEANGSVVFGVIGSGQAGGRIAESFYNLGYKKCMAVNTAEHDLDGLLLIPDNQKILMRTDTPGGAGKNMRIGESAAEKHQQEIYERMQKVFGSVDRILICAGGGGGTGGGSCLRLIETARKYLTYLGKENASGNVTVLLTLPTVGEAASPLVADNAHLIASKLCTLAEENHIGSLLIFDNEKIRSMYPKLTVKSFWPTVNATVTGLFHMFNILSNKVGNPTSFDPADYQRVLSAGGCMIMGFTTLKQYSDGTDVSKAVRGNLEKGLLCGGFEVSTAKAASCIATASDDILGNTPGLMASLENGFDTLANITGNATVFRGIYEVNKNKLVVYTMITGLSKPTRRLNDLKKFQENKTTQKSKLYE